MWSHDFKASIQNAFVIRNISLETGSVYCVIVLCEKGMPFSKNNDANNRRRTLVQGKDPVDLAKISTFSEVNMQLVENKGGIPMIRFVK